MGSYVLYLLAQAFGTLVFAYLAGSMAFKDRRPALVLVALGLYLFMGAGLLELSGDRSGWTRSGIGLYAGLVSMGVCCIGVGSTLRESESMEDSGKVRLLALALLVAGAVTALVLAALAGASTSVVMEWDGADKGISGAYSQLGPAGWALGSPLLIGAVLVIVAGLRAALARKDGGGFWLLTAGVLYLIWPFDIWLAGLPLAPMFLLLGSSTTYLGYQASQPSAEEMEEATEGQGEATGRVAMEGGVMEEATRGDEASSMGPVPNASPSPGGPDAEEEHAIGVGSGEGDPREGGVEPPA